MKVESEKVGLKLNIQKTKIMASGPITSWEISFPFPPRRELPLPDLQDPSGSGQLGEEKESEMRTSGHSSCFVPTLVNLSQDPPSGVHAPLSQDGS